ncbi:MAG: hypothetical protein ACP5HS_04730 [Anaerolineae bacterium]
MPVSYAPYDLREGYVHHWLVAGPQVIAIEDLESATDEAAKLQIAERHYEEDAGIRETPVEPGPLTESTFTIGDFQGLWTSISCGGDHFVDLTDFYPAPRYLRAFAYTELVSEDAQPLTVVLTARGPADVWLNGAHVYRGASFGLRHDTFELSLRERANELLVRFEQVGSGACVQQFALRIAGEVKGVTTRLPTAAPDLALRNKLESIFDSAYLDRDVFTRDEMITVQWPAEIGASEKLMIRLQTPSGRIYAESKAEARGGQTSTLIYALNAPQGPLRLRFMPPLELFYDEDLRVVRQMPLWGTGVQTYSDTPYDTYPQRRGEALRHAMRGDTLFAEIAKMALGQWDVIDKAVLSRAIDTVNRREVDSPVSLVGLLGILDRWGDHEKLPDSLKDLLEACVLNFEGWADASEEEGPDAAGESTRILLYTAEILAGQLYPDRVFAHSGQTGQWHRERAERLALDWLRRRGARGFASWDSGCAFERELVALSHLMDLAETEAVWQMVTVITDKLLLTVALNSYRGVFGATQGAADVSSITGGLLGPMAGIIRLLWGQGIFNHHLAGLVSMACMEDYQLPLLTAEIAIAQRDELWNRESHVITAEETVNKVTYRTPDYLLASAQDYRPGEPGSREHIWQATLGPEAVVYANHPASVGRSQGHVPGFWLGNVTLPRVAQWKDVLIAIYNLPEDDWMGYTHAYFPAYAFDAHTLRENAQGQTWAFAQKGDGYLALTASQGLTWITRGPGAYRELRSEGSETIWCCQMGRAALDGDFAAFQDRVLAQPLTFEGLAVTFESLRGETLAFGWEGAFLRDGKEEPLRGFKHYENPYCVADLGAPEMEIRSDHYLMRLTFG